MVSQFSTTTNCLYKAVFVTLISLVFIFINSPKTSAQQIKIEAETKITLLDSLIGVASEKGIDVVREEMVIRTAEIFLGYADFDETNQVELVAAFEDLSTFRDRATELAAGLPDKQRSDVVIILDESIEELKSLIAGEIVRPATPKVDYGEVSLDGDQLTYKGRPVFLMDYTWKPKTEQLMEYHGAEDGFFIAPSHSDGPNGELKSWLVSDLKSKPDGRLGFVFMNQRNPPTWLKEMYPDIEVGGRLYTHIDIDNPGSRLLWESIFSTLVPETAGKKYAELGYMLTNEPHWNTIKDRWETGEVSEYTYTKFRSWLKEKHKTIERLNELWLTAFNDFDDVNLTIPIPEASRGTAAWYDWMRFNQVRVTEWFTFLDAEIKKYDPDAKSHLKLIPSMWSGDLRDHGLHFEDLTRLSGINGNDAGARKFALWGGPYEWETEYGFEWQHLSMSYDFLASVEPGQINYNTETHYITKTAFYDVELDPNYVRAVFWLAHIQGADANQVWVWPREGQGKLRSNNFGALVGSPAHQPRVVKAIQSTVMDLNSYSEVIKSYQRERKSIRIFHSETSALIKKDHMTDMYNLYKSLYFEGVPLGFATEDIIKLNSNDWDVIIVNETEFVTQSELDALQTYLNNGGTIILDDKSLKKNEYGEDLSALSAGSGTIINASGIQSQSQQALQIAEANGRLSEIVIKETNLADNPGCVWRVVKGENGNNVLSIVNVGKTEAQVSVLWENAVNGVNAVDLLTGKSNGSRLTIPPFGVALLEIKDEKVDSEVLSSPETKALTIYPNPSNNFFKVRFPQIQQVTTISIMDVSGRTISNETYHNRAEITCSLVGQPVGPYFVEIVTGHQSKVYKVFKK